MLMSCGNAERYVAQAQLEEQFIILGLKNLIFYMRTIFSEKK